MFLNLWTWLNGKKTFIGIIAKAILKAVGQIKPELQPTCDSIDQWVNYWLAIGLTDKIRKLEVRK